MQRPCGVRVVDAALLLADALEALVAKAAAAFKMPPPLALFVVVVLLLILLLELLIVLQLPPTGAVMPADADGDSEPQRSAFDEATSSVDFSSLLNLPLLLLTLPLPPTVVSPAI